MKKNEEVTTEYSFSENERLMRALYYLRMGFEQDIKVGILVRRDNLLIVDAVPVKDIMTEDLEDQAKIKLSDTLLKAKQLNYLG